MGKKDNINLKENNNSFPIVAIGASAGGIEAVNELLNNLSPNTGMAFIYIQHLDPTHESKLTEILSRSTKMKVQEASHLLPIERNNIYVIPPNKDMSIVEGVLKLNPRAPKPNIHMPVDKFFNSLADKEHDASIGIVLSGNANDGTFGLKSIKRAGGITIAQDDTAKFKSMPESAIEEGVVDFILSPKDIARELERISSHPIIKQADETKEHTDIIDDDYQYLTNIIRLLKKATGVDFMHYKVNTIKRRIIRRMLLYKLNTLEEYYAYLKNHTNEINTLYQDLLINVTSFFRDGEMMEYLQKTMLPKIFNSKAQGEPVRIWIPACATGEEAYSLAISIIEVIEDNKLQSQVQIFATDLSDISISKARLGLYSFSELENISQNRLNRFFEKIDGSFRISKSIRDMCVFATHNVFKDPPFSQLDLISCCNLMIYLDTPLQKKILSIFHYALKNSGFLVLGKSETTSAASELFVQVEKKYKLYTKNKDTSANVVYDMNFRFRDDVKISQKTNPPKFTIKELMHPTNLEGKVDEILLQQFVPASVVVNDRLDILQFRGSTNLFLEPSPGKASLNLLKMIRPGLSLEIRNAVHKVNRSNEKYKKTGLEIKVKEKVHQVSLEVIPLPFEDDNKLFLIIFEEIITPDVPVDAVTESKDNIVKKLQNELIAAKEDMRSIIEEQEASMEELQSANEEIVSSNEELQSINEELETSKEEVESSNEELLTINNELQLRNDQLAESYEYSEVVFQTIQEAVVVLNSEFRVKKANHVFYEFFKVSKQETEGALLFELGNGQWDILKLRKLFEELAFNSNGFNNYEIEHDFPVIGKKIMLLKAKKIYQEMHTQQLIVLSILDITEHREAEKIISEREKWFRNMANNVPAMIWVTGTDKQLRFVNKTWLNYTGSKVDKIRNYSWSDCFYKDDRKKFLDIYHSNFEQKKSFTIEIRLRRYDDEYRWVSVSGEPTFSTAGDFTGYIGSCTEIHEKRMLLTEMENMVSDRTRELHEAVKDLEYTNSELNQYAYVASHDLQEPLRKIITFSDRLLTNKEEFKKEDQHYLEKIMKSAERMRVLINDLLNFSRMSRFSKEFVSADLNLLVLDVLKDLDLLIEEKKAKIIQDKLPVIKGVPFQLQQLIYNLINNALKFSKEKPVIHIMSRDLKQEDIKEFPSLNSDNSYCEIIFKDNGIGFKQEFADQVFTIFQRLNDKSKYSGAGIGLALCKKIAINHKGLIFAKSEPGKGASFHLILPCDQD